MDVNWQTLNPIFARIFPTFKPGNEWIDLESKTTGRPDGIKQPI
jgi:hypothetical protein